MGVSPYVVANARTKWNFDTRATRARLVEGERRPVVTVDMVTRAAQMRQQVGRDRTAHRTSLLTTLLQRVSSITLVVSPG